MTKTTKPLLDFLMALGIDKVAHTEKTYLAHLVNVHRLMETSGCSPELCLAGMAHSIYGTQQFQSFKIPLERRPELQALIGARAEKLAYLNCAMDRPTFDAVLDQEMEPYRFRDRITGEEVCLDRADFDDLCRVHLYDWLEQVPRSRFGYGYRRAAYRRMAERAGGAALAAYDRMFVAEPNAETSAPA